MNAVSIIVAITALTKLARIIAHAMTGIIYQLRLRHASVRIMGDD